MRFGLPESAAMVSANGEESKGGSPFIPDDIPLFTNRLDSRQLATRDTCGVHDSSVAASALVHWLTESDGPIVREDGRTRTRHAAPQIHDI
jgi:hypothetical protein